MPTSDGEKVSSIRHAGQQDVNFTCLGRWDEGPAREKKILR